MSNKRASPATSLLCSLLLAAASLLGTWSTVTLIEVTRSWYAGGTGIASPTSRWLPVFAYAAWNTAIVYWIARRGERYT